jgi:acetyl-CoA acetyltransferase family protein
MQLRNAVLVDGMRSAFARGGRGKFVATRLDEVAAQVLRTVLDRNPKVPDTAIEDIGLGNVLGGTEIVTLGYIGRLAGLPYEVPSFTTNRQCGSSMDTLHKIATSIMVGAIDCGIAIGVERMGRALKARGPGADGDVTRVNEFNKRLFEKTPVQRNMAHDHDDNFSVPIPDYLLDAVPIVSMVQTAQNVVEMYDLSREELDAFAYRSQKKTAAAYDKGIYKDEIVPVEIEEPMFAEDGSWLPDERGAKVMFDRDEGLRPNTTVEKLGTLPPVKGIKSFGDKELRVTAGNSCPTNDGVSCALLMSEEKARALGLEPLARIAGIGVAGVKPQIMGLGPIPATRKAMAHAGIEAGQIDRVEFNEAFAAQVIPSIKELGIPEERVNVNGGSIAVGHPLGATGARLCLTVAKELRRSNTRYGLGTQCIGAGMGISTILERMD